MYNSYYYITYNFRYYLNGNNANYFYRRHIYRYCPIFRVHNIYVSKTRANKTLTRLRL